MSILYLRKKQNKTIQKMLEKRKYPCVKKVMKIFSYSNE